MKPVYFGARKAAGHLLRVNTGRFIVWERSAYAVEDLYAIHNIEVVLRHTMGTRPCRVRGCYLTMAASTF